MSQTCWPSIVSYPHSFRPFTTASTCFLEGSAEGEMTATRSPSERNMELKLPVYCALLTSQGVSVPSDIVSFSAVSASSDAAACVAPCCTASAFSDVEGCPASTESAVTASRSASAFSDAAVSCPASAFSDSAASCPASVFSGVTASCSAAAFSDAAASCPLLLPSCPEEQEAHNSAHKTARQITTAAVLFVCFLFLCVFPVCFLTSFPPCDSVCSS